MSRYKAVKEVATSYGFTLKSLVGKVERSNLGCAGMSDVDTLAHALAAMAEVDVAFVLTQIQRRFKEWLFSPGDSVRCVDDRPHNGRALPSLVAGRIYEVAEFVEPCDVRLTELPLIWDATRFEKVQ